MRNVIRWGILGTGKIAHAFATALRQVPSAKLIAVASRSGEGAAKFGAEFDLPICHDSYQALANDAQVDVIYIATPHTMHAENALMCLNAGKHVLCEKPFTMNHREAAEVVHLARSKHLFLMEAVWTRFLPAIIEARRVIDSGEIGVPRQIHADFGFVANGGPEHRLLNAQLGGGALLDIGIYPLTMASYFLGPVEAVQAMAEMTDTGVDAQTAFVLRHRGGALSSSMCTIRATTPTEMSIAGDLGYLRLHRRFHEASSFTVTLDNGATRTVECPFIGNGYAHEAIEVMRCLRAGLIESPIMPHAETLRQMATLDTIREKIGLAYPADGK